MSEPRRPLAPRPTRPRVTALVAAALAAATAVGCGESAQARRYSRQQAQTQLASLESPGLVLGEFALASKPVLDGDTIRVEGLDATLRLLAIDSEETVKNKFDGRAIESDFEQYLADKRGDSARPVKSATPLGEEAKRFAIDFFAGHDRVRLERDHPKEIRDAYDRYLAYVFVEKGGAWVNYNVECVRAGMSPYFTKYSYSRRFHEQFVAAEKEARAAGRGIWAAGAHGYGDYDERKPWWDARADFLRKFEQAAEGKDDHIVLTHWDSLARLEKHKGEEVTVIGTVDQVTIGERGPSRVSLTRRRFGSIPVIFFDKDVYAATGIARMRGEFVAVTGVVNEYQSKRSKRRQLQLVVSLPSQVVVSPVLETIKPRPTAPPTTPAAAPASAPTATAPTTPTTAGK